MRVLVLGAAGMIGAKLVSRLLDEGSLAGRTIDALDLFDVVEPKAATTGGVAVRSSSGDIADRATVEALIADQPDIVFHLAAIVSGEAEADFDKGYRINLDGTHHLLESIRALGEGYCPRVVFTSSIAVFGAPFPETIPDDFHLTPLTSYGTQKAIGELLLADYSRRGILDGVGLRLPTIVVRPGKPNKAASGFFSGIIREPLAGQEAILPVGDDVKHWMASPAAAVGFLVHAAEMDTFALGARRSLTMPGVAATVGEMIETLRRVAGDEAVGRIRRQPDATIQTIVAGWPRSFEADRARQFGFTADDNFEALVRAYIADQKAAGAGAAPAGTGSAS